MEPRPLCTHPQDSRPLGVHVRMQARIPGFLTTPCLSVPLGMRATIDRTRGTEFQSTDGSTPDTLLRYRTCSTRALQDQRSSLRGDQPQSGHRMRFFTFGSPLVSFVPFEGRFHIREPLHRNPCALELNYANDLFTSLNQQPDLLVHGCSNLGIRATSLPFLFSRHSREGGE
jgi:hypothetical protein